MGRSWQSLAQSGPTRPDFVGIGPNRSSRGNFWSSPGSLRATSQDARRATLPQRSGPSAPSASSESRGAAGITTFAALHEVAEQRLVDVAAEALHRNRCRRLAAHGRTPAALHGCRAGHLAREQIMTRQPGLESPLVPNSIGGHLGPIESGSRHEPAPAVTASLRFVFVTLLRKGGRQEGSSRRGRVLKAFLLTALLTTPRGREKIDDLGPDLLGDLRTPPGPRFSNSLHQAVQF